MVRSIEEGKALACAMAGVDPRTTEFVEDPDLRVEPIWIELMRAGNPTKKQKREMQDAVAHQHGFRFKNSKGKEVAIVIDRFRGGFCVWSVLPNGYATRF